MHGGMTQTEYDLFIACAPGLEPALATEMSEAGFAAPKPVPGGVETTGDWAEVRRANLVLRGAVRVLVRIGGFRAFHLAQLDKRARKFGWSDVLRPDIAVRVEATCVKSKIYHAGAATQRIERAISEELGAPIAKDAPIRILARIDDNLVTFSIDTSGAPLHKRGHKEFVGKAPLRESMAALFLRACGYTGDEPVLDPMCGSGTFLLEAAERAMGLAPGRSRAFAFEDLAGFDGAAWLTEKAAIKPTGCGLRFYGSDRDQGAIRGAQQNAERAGVSGACQFTCHPITELQRPDGPPGLIMINPPYGARIGNKKPLFALHAGLGQVLKDRFSGWRVGIVTSEAGLARATGLPFVPTGAPVAHGGLKVKLYRTGVLA